MRVYTLTELGRKVAATKNGASEEMRVLHFLYNNRTATDSELEVVGGEKWLLRRLIQRGLVRELTS